MRENAKLSQRATMQKQFSIGFHFNIQVHAMINRANICTLGRIFNMLTSIPNQNRPNPKRNPPDALLENRQPTPKIKSPQTHFGSHKSHAEINTS